MVRLTVLIVLSIVNWPIDFNDDPNIGTIKILTVFTHQRCSMLVLHNLLKAKLSYNKGRSVGLHVRP